MSQPRICELEFQFKLQQTPLAVLKVSPTAEKEPTTQTSFTRHNQNTIHKINQLALHHLLFSCCKTVIVTLYRFISANESRVTVHGTSKLHLRSTPKHFTTLCASGTPEEMGRQAGVHPSSRCSSAILKRLQIIT